VDTTASDRAARSPFIGRRDALDHLAAAVAAARLGRFAGVLVVGPGGVGKSRLLDRLIEQTADDGSGRLLHVSCQAPAETGPASPLESVAPLLAAAGLDLAAQAAGEADDAHDAQERSFRAAGDAVEKLAQAYDAVLVTVEDLHRADLTSLELLAYLARRLDRSPVAVLASLRDGAGPAPVRAVITSLSLDAGVTQLHVGGLTRDELAELAEARTGAPLADTALDDVLARSGGITLYAEELIDSYARSSDSGAPDATDAPGKVPASLRTMLHRSLDPLSDCSRDLVELLAVAGGEAGHGLLREAASLDDDELRSRLDDVLDTGVVVVDDDLQGYRFRHDLLLEAVLDAIDDDAARAHHAELAAALTARPDLAPRGSSPMAALALHRRLGGDPDGALVASVAAAREAGRAGACAEELEHRLVALDLLESLGRPQTEVGPALADAARAASRAGLHARAAELMARVVEQQQPSPMRLRLEAERMAEQYLAGDSRGAMATARTMIMALDDSTPPAVRAGVLATCAAAFVDPSLGRTPLEATTEAVEIARGLDGDPTGILMRALTSHGLALALYGRIDEAVEVFDEAEELSAQQTDPREALRAVLYRLLYGFDPAADIERGRHAIARADRMGAARGVGKQLRAVVADLLLATGRWDELRTVVADGLAWGSQDFAGMLLRLDAGFAALCTGRLADAEAELAAAREVEPAGHPRTSQLAAEIAWWQGDQAASAAHAMEGLQLAVATARGNEVAPLTYALARALPADPPPPASGVLELALGQLAATAGNPVTAGYLATARAERSDSPDAWSAAAACWQSLGHEPLQTYAVWRQATALASAGRRPEAQQALSRAEESARRLGLTPLLGALESAGAAIPRQRGAWAGTPEAERLGLTGREAEVLDLLAEGWSNKRIGEHLHISPRTVGIHVSSILRKLGVSTRGEAAALARRLAP
jgi:DNA-binding CsgD family transcriptional regulator